MKQIKQIFTLLIIQMGISILATAQVPVLDWSTYFGGQLTQVRYVKVDSAHQQIIVSGITADSTGIATVGSYKESMGPMEIPMLPELIYQWELDLFIAKFDLDGNLIWSTYYGGDKTERLTDMAVDGDGNIYISGYTNSATGIATIGAHLSDIEYIDTVEGVIAPFLTKFSPSGMVEWGTYYGSDEILGGNNTTIHKIAIDHNDKVYICGTTRSTQGISTVGSWQASLKGEMDGFIAKFDVSGNRIWGTYYGNWNISASIETDVDEVNTLYVDPDNNIIITGDLNNDGISMGTDGTYKPNPLEDSYNNPYMAKFSNSGSRLWHTYLDAGTVGDMVTDETGNIYMAGMIKIFQAVEGVTTVGVYQDIYGGGSTDIILSKFSPSGNRIWATYYGGNDDDFKNYHEGYFQTNKDIQMIKYSPHNGGNIYIYGSTNSTVGIDNDCSYESTTDYRRGFIGRYDLNGYLHYSGYYDESINNMDILIDKNGQPELYIVASTTLDGLATEGSFKDNKTGLTYCGYITKFTEECPINEVSITYTENILTASDDFHIYNWYHNDTLIHADSTTYTYTASNSINITDTTGYYYCIAIKCGCAYRSDTITFSTSGIIDKLAHEPLTIYPNPGYNGVIIASSKIINLKGTLNITDMNGSVVYTQEIKNQNNSIKIDIRDFPVGNYIITIHSKTGIFAGKITKK